MAMMAFSTAALRLPLVLASSSKRSRTAGVAYWDRIFNGGG
jgi:hypothetical protein